MSFHTWHTYCLVLSRTSFLALKLVFCFCPFFNSFSFCWSSIIFKFSALVNTRPCAAALGFVFGKDVNTAAASVSWAWAGAEMNVVTLSTCVCEVISWGSFLVFVDDIYPSNAGILHLVHVQLHIFSQIFATAPDWRQAALYMILSPVLKVMGYIKEGNVIHFRSISIHNRLLNLYCNSILIRYMPVVLKPALIFREVIRSICPGFTKQLWKYNKIYNFSRVFI